MFSGGPILILSSSIAATYQDGWLEVWQLAVDVHYLPVLKFEQI